MVGEDGLEEELEMVGLRVVKEAARPPTGMTEDEFRENDHDPEVTGSVSVNAFVQAWSIFCWYDLRADYHVWFSMVDVTIRSPVRPDLSRDVASVWIYSMYYRLERLSWGWTRPSGFVSCVSPPATSRGERTFWARILTLPTGSVVCSCPERVRCSPAYRQPAG